MLLRGQVDVAYPVTDRRLRNADPLGDLFDRSPFVAAQRASSFPLVCFHNGKHNETVGRKSARPGSNRRDDLGRVACYHYTTGASPTG